MRKVLVVGCGGSGAKTLAFMMDQLKTSLAELMPQRFPTAQDVVLPKAWQFVSVDVPTVAEGAGKNLPNVSQAGGQYISCGSSGSYSTVDAAVTRELAGERELGTICSWAISDPDAETTDVAAGAGQYRAIGRMLFLSKMKDTLRQLESAWNVLSQAETNSELTLLRSELKGKAQSASENTIQGPLVFVVSSMAGGAGASMALDVCRLLTFLNGFKPQNTSLFMVTPDIFSNLNPASVVGANPNALAMFAELLAAQTGAAMEEDARVFNALGVGLNPGITIPVARIFPVGVKSGVQGAQLGDGNADTVYRALGRGLAALMVDEKALADFSQYKLVNKAGLQLARNDFGWGVSKPDNLPWGTYGYAQLSMGRDRYGEYAAQRLASSAVNKLLKGHVDVTNPASEDAQIEEKISNNLRGIQHRITEFLPTPGQAGNWIFHEFANPMNQWVDRLARRIRDRIPKAHGQRGRDWLPAVEQALATLRSDVNEDTENLLYGAVYHWASSEMAQERLVDLVRTEVAKYGVPYGREVLALVRNYLKDSIIKDTRAVADNQNVLALNADMKKNLHGTRGRINDDAGYIEKIVETLVPDLRRCAVVLIARMMAPVLEDYLKNFVAPLESSMQSALAELEHWNMKNDDPNLGIAQLRTDVPRLWPDETQATVPNRFNQAANEVFLTDVSTFPQQFEHDIIESARSNQSDHLDFVSGLNIASQCVVGADWESAAGSEEAPRDLLNIIEPWVARELTVDPTGSGLRQDPRPARFAFNILPAQVLERSRQYIRRPGYSFQRFIATSLRQYIVDPSLPQHVRDARRQQVVSRFVQAMENALPLAQINADLVQHFYNQAPSYNFTFSRIPFRGDPMEQMLSDAVSNFPNYDGMGKISPLEHCMDNQGEERSIDIFGSYPNYIPIVFDSLLPAIADQWNRSGKSGDGFWTGRRARPLPAALPMADEERHALIMGWYIGRLTGTVYCPGTMDANDDEPVQVYDHGTQSWVNFATPMLRPVSRFRSTLDWLPSLLESVSMAWARAGETPLMASLYPYVLLRKLYDDSTGGPAASGRTLRAQRLLQEWLFSGERKSGEIHQIPGTEASASPEQRLEAAKTWLTTQGQNAMAFVPTSKAGAGQLRTNANREFGDIRDRQIAAKVTSFHDIAADVAKATAELIGLLDKAYQAGPPMASGPANVFQVQDSGNAGFVMPGEGDF